MIIDLHIHTRYSDGTLTVPELTDIFLQGDTIAVTDHNSVAAWPSVQSLCTDAGLRWIPGFEFRLRGQPDYLLYFPTLSGKDGFLRTELDELNAADHNLSRLCYENDFGLDDFDRAFEQAQTVVDSYETTCGTLHLAHMLRMRAPDRFGSWRDALKPVRRAKGAKIDTFGNMDADGRPGWTHILLESQDPLWPFAFARRHGGEVVLAHPMQELRRASPTTGDGQSLGDRLCGLFAEFASQGGNCVEICQHPWNELASQHDLKGGVKHYWDTVLSVIGDLELTVTIGSDLHAGVEEARKNREDLEEIATLFAGRFPRWLEFNPAEHRD